VSGHDDPDGKHGRAGNVVRILRVFEAAPQRPAGRSDQPQQCQQTEDACAGQDLEIHVVGVHAPVPSLDTGVRSIREPIVVWTQADNRVVCGHTQCGRPERGTRWSHCGRRQLTHLGLHNT
jgi:hypothetical protein